MGTKTIVEPRTEAPAAGTRDVARRPQPSETWQTICDLLAPIASLRLTVVLFVLAIALVFFGSLAQRFDGIQTVLENYFRVGFGLQPFRVGFAWIPLQLFFAETVKVGGGFWFPGGWLIGGLMMTNLLAAHAVHFQLNWKRAGILVLHAGIVVMMVSEFITGMWAVEGNMTIREGETVNFVEHHSRIELAIVDSSKPKTDDVVVVPASKLLERGPLRHEFLPFDIELVKYMKNSALLGPMQVKPGAENPATAGVGVKAVAAEQPEVSGSDPDQKVDLPSVYVTLKRKGGGESLGTYLFSLWLDPQPVAVDGKSFDVSLRFARTYKPYRLQLKEFRHDLYLGTNTPKNFSSLVQLVDPERHEDRDVKIWMNHPLRHAGETFFQSGVLPNDAGTILQVVRNPGWLMPYVSCFMVAVGMLVHFGTKLITFLDRTFAAATPAKSRSPRPSLKSGGNGAARRVEPSSNGDQPHSAALPDWISLGIPAAVAACAVFYFLAVTRRPADAGAMHFTEFGKLPVVYAGRHQPMDTLARNALMMISGNQSFKDSDGHEQPATRWLLDVMTTRSGDKGLEGPALEHKVFRIENDEVLKLLGLESRPGSFRYAIDEFRPKFKELMEQAKQADEVPPKNRTLYQRKVVEIASRLRLFQALAVRHDPHLVPPLQDDGDWMRLDELFDEAHAKVLDELKRAVQRGELDLEKVSKDDLLTAVDAKSHAVIASGMLGNAPIEPIEQILDAYEKDNAAAFNAAVAAYHDSLDTRFPAVLAKADLESIYNHVKPFMQCMVLYLAAFVLACLSWLGWHQVLRRSAFALILPTVVVHAAALVARMYLQDRWFVFVTNLYSSAIFIGFGCVVVAIINEFIFRRAIALAIAGVTGFLTLFVAYNLSLDGDTLEMMQAVLDTNFWLATHVTCVTLGYAATFKAGFIAILFILYALGCRVGMFEPDEDVTKAFNRMIYGILCFATLLSFTGTVLGGIWADQSWGRFWGWDPKENGALMIVAWNALILHARWSGLAQSRGVAVLAVLGNVVTAWSWFGVNLLGVGLHAYGGSAVDSMKDLKQLIHTPHFWLAAFVFSQLVFAGLGCALSTKRREGPTGSGVVPA